MFELCTEDTSSAQILFCADRPWDAVEMMTDDEVLRYLAYGVPW